MTNKGLNRIAVKLCSLTDDPVYHVYRWLRDKGHSYDKLSRQGFMGCDEYERMYQGEGLS